MSEATAVGLPVPDRRGPEPSATVAQVNVAQVNVAQVNVAQCHRVGRMWRLVLRNRSVLVEDSIGMVHLAVLIANPRQEIHAADLVAGLAGLSGASGGGAGSGPAHPRDRAGS